MPNRLLDETSPYLLQHAHNPVDWYPWGPEALELARAENKPILLSIGYAACHWCHVMERESFENSDIARQMNMWFVCIKVDREERPDLDGIYMDAVQAMTGRGGWPMTVFLTPDGKPFYGGTYFPPEDRHGMPGLPRVLESVHDAWINKRDDVTKQADALTSYISGAVAPKHEREHDLTDLTLRAAVGSMREQFDDEWGGFGSAPKFPQPMTLEFLLRTHVRGEADALPMAVTTLERMARGGIFDHVGGGFHRYSTDRQWLVPHFEKMLYDNGALLRSYARAWLVTRSPLFRRTAELTADYVLREMRHADGGFFSSQDADSEGVEGKFYVWSRAELVAVAGDDAARYWDVTERGNWEGTNVLWVPADDAEPAGLEDARLRLREARASRVAPATDDKILASWNGIAISGLCEAGRAFGRPDLISAAGDAARFVLSALRDSRGRLLRAWRDGRTSGLAFLDDHALMAAACLDLYESTFDESWYAEAERLVDDAIRLFADERGGFYDTGSDAEALLVRPKDLFDNAVPCGNSTMAETLIRLGALRGDPMLESRVEPMLKLLQPAMASSPTGFGTWLGALDVFLARPREIAVAGDPAEPGARALIETVWGRFLPNHVLAAGDPSVATVPLLRDRPLVDGRATAYVCEGFVCLRPVTEPDDLVRELS
jgi:uncharacterized protein YyaL (SSP411 family)